MTRTMGDSTSLAAIPLTVQIAAAYDDGHLGVATPAQMEARFPHREYGWVFIDVTGQHADTADVLDVEAGDATPPVASLWVQSWHVLKRPGLPVLYVNRGNEQAVIDACAAAGLHPGQDYGLWVATLDGTVVGPGGGVVACQVKGAGLTGGNWDMSLVYDASLWLPAAPYPVPGGLSATVHATVNLAWNDTGSPYYRWQVASGTPDSPGTMIAGADVAGTHAAGITLPVPGPWIWRVQSAGNSPFTPWAALDA